MTWAAAEFGPCIATRHCVSQRFWSLLCCQSQAEIENKERFWIFLFNPFNLARKLSLTKGEALQPVGWWGVVRSISHKWRKCVDCFPWQLTHSWVALVDFLLCVTELLYRQHCYHTDEREHKRSEANWDRSIIYCVFSEGTVFYSQNLKGRSTLG